MWKRISGISLNGLTRQAGALSTLLYVCRLTANRSCRNVSRIAGLSERPEPVYLVLYIRWGVCSSLWTSVLLLTLLNGATLPTHYVMRTFLWSCRLTSWNGIGTSSTIWRYKDSTLKLRPLEVLNRGAWLPLLSGPLSQAAFCTSWRSRRTLFGWLRT